MAAAIVATIIVATAAGVWAERRYGAAGPRLARRALRVTLYAGLPPVVFFNIARADIDADAGLGIALMYVALAITVTASYFICTRVLNLSRPATGSVLCCIMVPNSGYLGYPVTTAALGADKLGEAVVFDILVAAPWLLIGAFSVGAAFGTLAGETPADRVRAFFTRNPPLYAAVLAVIAPDALAPDVLVDASRVLVIAILPIGFFAVGTALAEEAEEGALAFPPQVDGAIVLSVLGRMALAPVLLIALAAPLIDLPATYVLLAAMPSGINAVLVTHVYGLDLRITAGAIAWSTAVALAGLVVLSVVQIVG